MILVLGHLLNFISYQSPSITQFILVTLPPYCSSNILSTLRPQGLCTAWNTLPSISHVAHIPPLTAGLCSNAIPSLISSLTIYLRYHTRLFPLLYLLFLQTTYHYYKITYFCLFSPLNYRLKKGKKYVCFVQHHFIKQQCLALVAQ